VFWREVINDVPIYIDFNSGDEDGAIWLILPIEDVYLKKLDLQPKEGQVILVSDGDVEMIGTITFRGDRWVVVPEKGTIKNVEKDSPYHK
jgi:hypothetical protein